MAYNIPWPIIYALNRDLVRLLLIIRRFSSVVLFCFLFSPSRCVSSFFLCRQPLNTPTGHKMPSHVPIKSYKWNNYYKLAVYRFGGISSNFSFFFIMLVLSIRLFQYFMLSLYIQSWRRAEIDHAKEKSSGCYSFGKGGGGSFFTDCHKTLKISYGFLTVHL